MKPGWKSTEFWAMASWGAFTMVVGYYWLRHPWIPTEQIVSIWGAPGIPAAWWLQSRTGLKRDLGVEKSKA